MKKVPLYFPFALALTAVLFGSVFFPFLRLNFFSPFLALAYYAAPLSKALWISVGCGVILDAVSSEFKFGVQTLTFVLATLLLYSQKKHFFEHKPLALSLFTMVIASATTFLQLILVHLFDRGVPFSAGSALIDGVLMPAVDGLYAFLWFTSPIRLYTYIKKVGWRKLFRRLQHEEE